MAKGDTSTVPPQAGTGEPAAAEAAESKKTRQVAKKPWMAQIALKVPPQPEPGEGEPEDPFRKLLEANGNVVWLEIPTPSDINNTLDALKWIETNEALPAGRYRVVQLCADKTKNVETKTTTSMT